MKALGASVATDRCDISRLCAAARRDRVGSGAACGARHRVSLCGAESRDAEFSDRRRRRFRAGRSRCNSPLAVCCPSRRRRFLFCARAACPSSRRCTIPALRRDGLYVRGRIALPFVGRPLQLSIANAFRRRQRVVLTLLALATGGAVFLGADNLRESVRAPSIGFSTVSTYDVAFRIRPENIQPHRSNRWRRKSMVSRARRPSRARRRASCTRTALLGDAFSVIGMPPDSPLIVPLLDQGRWLNRRGRQRARRQPKSSEGRTVDASRRADRR